MDLYKKILELDTVYEGEGQRPPDFETSDPKEAIREVVKRFFPGVNAVIPISENLQLNLGPDREISAGGQFDVGGGELSVGGGMRGDDKAFGIRFRKEFDDGGRAAFGRGAGPATIKVREYLKTLPKNSEIVVLDVADKLKVDRGVVDNVLKEKEFKKKQFQVLRKAGFLTNKKFAEEYKKFQKSKFFDTGTDNEFANYLNDKGLKAETPSGKHTAKSVNMRRQRLNIKSVSPSAFRLSDNFVLKEAKRFKINTKGLSSEEIRSKVLDKRQAENLLKKRAEDPELDERIKKEAIERADKRRKRLLSTEEGRAILKEQSQKYKAKKYLEEGLDPPANSPKEMLWKDTVKTAKEDSRFSIKSGYEKSMKKGDYYSDKIKIKDTITGKTFTFNTLENFINKNANSFNISNYDEVIKPYKQKQFINDKGLRNILNEALIPNYNPGNPANAFTIQHDFGRKNNPFKVSLAFYDDNLKEYKVRSDFEKAWEKSKRSKTPLADRKKAFNIFKEDISKLNIQSAPSMITRDRVFGEGLDLTKAIRAGKDAGAKIPKGIFKEAAEFDINLTPLANIGCPNKKADGGRVNFSNGQDLVACAIKGAEKLQNSDPKKLDPLAKSNIKTLTKTASGARFLKNVLGPAAIAFEGLFALPFAALDFAEGRKGSDILKNALSLGLMDSKLRRDELKEFFPGAGQADDFINAIESLKNLQKQLSGTKKQRERAIPKYNIAFDNMMETIQPFMRPNPQLTEGQFFDPLLLEQSQAKEAEAMQKVLDARDKRKQDRGIGEYAKPFDFSYGEFSNGGIAGLSGGDKSGPPPERGPDSEGLRSLMKRGINL